MGNKTHTELALSDFTVGDEDIDALRFGIVFRDKYDNKVKRIHLTKQDAGKLAGYLLTKLAEELPR